MQTAKTIPTTTAQACAKYRTRRYKCDCPDYTTRGGSYYYGGNVNHRVCKHIAAVLCGQIEQDEILAIEQAITVSQVRAERIARLAPHFPVQKPATLPRFDYLELDQPKAKEPTAEELFARFA